MSTSLSDRIIGTPALSASAARALRGRLRILAYHNVTDALAFERQVEHLVADYRVVSANDILRFLDGADLPPRPVWLTFDDGFADVIERGLPVLRRHGVVATLFVCPGLVEGGLPLWTDRVRAAVDAGSGPEGWPDDAGGDDIVCQLKRMPDAVRRDIVDSLPAIGSAAMADEAGLRRWVEAGQHLGNHTWDHPCLPTCDPAEQGRQIASARAWLEERFADQPRMFAYPNGDSSAAVERAVADAGESSGLLFDHRLVSSSSQRFRLSRLRVDSTAELSRFRSIVSGLHPMLFQVRTAIRASR
jgi:peptidoglycan/xylan/chitin deacetylase (PgdA/CDA1 family)